MAASRQLWKQSKCLRETACRRALQVSATADPSNTEIAAALPPKTIHDLNGPPAWPLVGNFVQYMKKCNRGRLHEMLAEQHQQYGRMFKEKLGPATQLHVCDPDLIQKIYRNHGKYPVRPPFGSWILYRKVTREKFGPVTANGEEWMKLRQTLNKRLLKPKAVHHHADEISDVITEMVVRLRHIRDQNANGQTVAGLPNELYKWAMESVGTVMFETRMGCLREPVPPRVQEFIDNIGLMLASSLQMVIGEGLHQRLNTPFWKKHTQAWNKLFEITREFIDSRVEAINQTLQKSPEEVYGSFLGYFLASTQLTRQELHASIVELLLGGVDTTSNTMCFTLLQLARNPRVQDALHEEVTNVLKGRQATPDDLQHMPYLKNVVKETLRLFPTVPMNVRILEDDIELNGHTIPKKTLIVLNHHAACRDPAIFDEPENFLPERWDRDKREKIHSFASLPFGFGTRGCIGRRLAEMEIHLALARITQEFKMVETDKVEFKPFLRTLLSPGDELPIEFHDR